MAASSEAISGWLLVRAEAIRNHTYKMFDTHGLERRQDLPLRPSLSPVLETFGAEEKAILDYFKALNAALLSSLAH